jgi:hypothetical protein
MVLLQLKLESSQPDSCLSTNENWMPIGDNLPELPPALAGGEKSVIEGFSQIVLAVGIALLDVTEIANHYFRTTIPTVSNFLNTFFGIGRQTQKNRADFGKYPKSAL